MAGNTSAIIVVMVAVCMVAVTVPAVIVASEDSGEIEITVIGRGTVKKGIYYELADKINAGTSFKAQGYDDHLSVMVNINFTCGNFTDPLYDLGIYLEPSVKVTQADPITSCTLWYLM